MKCLKYILFALVLMFNFFKLNAEDISSQKNQGFEEKKWQELVSKLDYDEQIKPKKEEEKIKPLKIDEPDLKISPIFKYVFLIIAVLLVLFAIVVLIKNQNKRNVKNLKEHILKPREIDEETPDEIVLSELELAVQSKNFKLAYRLKYLQSLKLLIAKNIIVYRKHDTNFKILSQLFNTKFYEVYRTITIHFDGVWYSESEIDEKQYNLLLPLFEQFNNLIKHHE